MLLKLYIVSVFMCMIGLLMIRQAIINRFIAEKPTIYPSKISCPINYKALVPLLIPIVNIVLIVSIMLFFDEIYEEVWEDFKWK